MEYVGVVVSVLFDPMNFIVLLLASAMGVVFGALPGLSGTIGVALMLPITFGMPPELGIAMLICIWVGGVSGGFIAATLLGIPGTASNVATCYDAYPLSQKGQSQKALGIGIIASFISTFFSCIVAMFLSKFIANLAVKLGPWEIFSLCFCAISAIVSLSRQNIFKGLSAASFGLILSSVGFAPVDAYNRFTFGNIHLGGGFDGVALMLGLFAIYLISYDYYKKNQSDASTLNAGNTQKGFGVTLKEFKDNIFNIVRSFFIGLWIGFLPGMGAGLSNLVAYSTAKNASKHPEEFGKGSLEGIFASESSNNASVGGALIPMVSLGIPGDATTAVLLGGLTIHGIEPGPLLFTNNPSLVYVMFFSALFAAVVIFGMQYFGVRLFPKILQIPYHYLYPTIIILCFVGAFITTNTIFNIGLMLVFAAIGVLMKWADLPAVPFLLSMILGKMLESNLRRGFSYSPEGIITFLTRPVSAIFLAIGVASILISFFKEVRKS